MAMQHTPLLMHRILDRGAKVAPGEEVVTATEDGARRQTYLETRRLINAMPEHSQSKMRHIGIITELEHRLSEPD